MTIFLCILALLALDAAPDIKGEPGARVVVAMMACWVLLVLGLATLALVAHLW